MIPIAILQLIEFYEKPSEEYRFRRDILHIPIGIFGLILFCAGISMFVWVFYNIFIEEQVQFHMLGGTALIASFVFLGWHLMKIAIFKPKKNPENSTNSLENM